MPYPLRFEPVYQERPWGGHALARLGKALPAGRRIGESWEISDRDQTQTLVAKGLQKGRSLHEIVEAGPGPLLGTNVRQGPDPQRFPLLIKLLDARERLSLQVHPPAAVATQLGGEPKTEMWYVLDAEPGAQLIAGLRRGVTREQFTAALHATNGAHDSDPDDGSRHLLECVHHVPIGAGEAFFMPSGRVHAVGAGLVLVEIQQNSDTTYRVCDWGRLGLDGQPRPLHIQQSLRSIDFQDFEPQKSCPRSETHGANRWWRLVECEFFHTHRLALKQAWEDVCDGSSFHVIACVGGAVGIVTPGNEEERLRVGEFALLPAALGAYQLVPRANDSQALKVFIPIPNWRPSTA